MSSQSLVQRLINEHLSNFRREVLEHTEDYGDESLRRKWWEILIYSIYPTK